MLYGEDEDDELSSKEIEILLFCGELSTFCD